MDYLRIYKKIVRRAFHSERHRNDGNYYEGHHVKPKSLGGRRIVLLTAREHFLAHFLLFKHYKKHGNSNSRIKMARAFKAMTFSSKDNIQRYTSRSFDIARRAFNDSLRGENHPMFGKKHSKEVIDKIKLTLSLRNEDDILAMKAKQRKAKLGIKWTDEKRRKILESRRRYYDNRPPKYEIIMPDGSIHRVAGLDRFIKANNLSRSMMRRYIDNGPVMNTNNIQKSGRVNNTVGIIVNTIKEDTNGNS